MHIILNRMGIGYAGFMNDNRECKISCPVLLVSDQEKCGCKLLEKFDITQPTLSHHMKILVDSGLVKDRKEGKWHYYSINTDIMKEFFGFIKTLCNETTGKCCKGEP